MEVIAKIVHVFEFLKHELSNVSFVKIGRGVIGACFNKFQLLYGSCHRLNDFKFDIIQSHA